MSTRPLSAVLLATTLCGGLAVAGQLHAESAMDAAVDAGSVPDAGKLQDAPRESTQGEESERVTILVQVFPSVRATVSWGRKRLGVIRPRGTLAVKRPRDSGPLDLIVRAEGYLPVQTRAYTFENGRLQVRLTAVEEINTLLGYREPLDAGVDGGMDDAGVDAGDATAPSATAKADAGAATPADAGDKKKEEGGSWLRSLFGN